MRYIQYYESPLGKMIMSSDGTLLNGLWFTQQKYFTNIEPGEYKEKNSAVFDKVRKWLDLYFAGDVPDFIPPLAMETTEFRKAVWKILLTIPYGQTMTYGEIADKIAEEWGIARMSAQAVGGAVGHNAISIIIPCHRVVGANGNLTGYGGGIAKKVKLLEIEKVDMTSFFIPQKGTAL